MADNVPITAGTGTDIATDDIASQHYQRMKLIHGADGTNDGDVAKTNPYPVQMGHALTRGLSLALITALAASGDNNVVAADGAKTIKIHGWCWKVKGSVNVKWRDAVATAADYHPALNFTASGDGMIVDPLGFPLFTSKAGGDLKLNLSAAVEVNGWVFYTQE